MFVPNSNQAYVPREKILNYLLSLTHAIGKNKAKFFRAHGYHDENAQYLEDGLMRIVQTTDFNEEIATPYGTKYVVDGILKTPRGPEVHLRTVWIVEIDEHRPRFVTAFPI